MRFILCNLISLAEWDGRDVDRDLVDATMPALGYSNLMKHWGHPTIPRFVKTHQPYRPVIFATPARVLYVLRDPRDVMVSFFHYRGEHDPRLAARGFAAFIRDDRHGLHACLRHYSSWRSRVSHVIRYEDLYRDAESELRRTLDRLRIDISGEVVHEAVNRCAFDRLRARDGDGSFFRKGIPGQWRDWFTADDAYLFAAACAEHGFQEYDHEP